MEAHPRHMSSTEARQGGKSTAQRLRWVGMPLSVQGEGQGSAPTRWGPRAAALRARAHTAGDSCVLCQQGGGPQCSLRCISDISRDAVIPVSENFIFFVKLPFIFANGHCKPFLFKIRFLFFSNGCFF